MLKKIFIGWVLLTTPAMAQQQSTPEVEALGAKLMQEISGGIICNTTAITLKREVDRLTTENAALKKQVPPAKKD